MAFNSPEFIFVFLPAGAAGYFLLDHVAGRTVALAWLLLASIIFYACAGIASLAIITPSILLDYLIASTLLRLDLSRVRLRQLLFAAGLASNVAFLGYFKYKNFFLDVANTVLQRHFELTALILPLGISFITFQKIAFLADVQSGQVRKVRFFDFLLFTLFFPRIVAGPIVRYQEVMPQLTEVMRRPTGTDAAVGACLFSIGLFKKTIIADGLAPCVAPTFEPAFPDLLPLGMITAWTGVLAYSFQLYFDFSGYSDMALGVARMFGVRLPMNFNSPFKASSILEFWSRWHITLTRFLTAYIYTPIMLHLTRTRATRGMSVLRGRRSPLSAIAAIIGVPTLITMIISGFWHGAGWQFIVWGALHGIYLTLNQSWRILRPRFWPDQRSYERVMKPMGFILTFGAVVIALVFFRATSVASAWSILGSMAGINGVLHPHLQVLQSVGIQLPWSIVVFMQPTTPLVWISVLFLVATLMPNSLEILRQLQPALDFPGDDQNTQSLDHPMSAPQRPSARRRSLAARLHAARVVFGQMGRQGVPLTPLAATIAALLFTLGVMALNRGGAFLYGQF